MAKLKNLAKGLLVAGAMASAGIASADWAYDELRPMAGLDFRYSWIGRRSGFDTFFQRSFPGFTPYLAARFCDCLGFEIGYDFFQNRQQDFTLAAGSTVLGRTVPAGGIVGNSTLRFYGGHIDLLGFYPVASCIDLIGALGIGYLHPRVRVSIFTGAGSPLGSGVTSIAGRGHVLGRIRIGGSYMLSDCIGARVMLGYENTSVLTVRGNPAFSGISTRPFGDMVSVTGGVFLTF